MNLKQFTTKLKSAKCPVCRTRGRLLRGAFYDPGNLLCQECGHRTRVKGPKKGEK